MRQYMKHIIAIAIFSLVIAGCGGMNNQTSYVESLSPEQVNAEIESFREFIIPPKGTSKEDVDAVFEVSDVIEESKDKGSYIYPLHIYDLLPSIDGEVPWAFMYVSYTNDKIVAIGINHYCVVKGRTLYDGEAIEKENVQVLKDLIDIKKKFKNKLNKASWNQ